MVIMNWINPRENLPEIGQIIWCLFIENREGDQSGLPCAKMTLCEVDKDRYGVIYAKEITHKGYAQYIKHFFDWWHWDQSDKDPGLDTIYEGFSSRNEDDNIVAWIPYDGLPLWDYINIKESKKIITKTEDYKKGVEYDKSQRIIKKAQGSTPYFIYLSESEPIEKGCYVVANKNGVWLSNFDPTLKEQWLAPNGEPVIVWYAIPHSY